MRDIAREVGQAIHEALRAQRVEPDAMYRFSGAIPPIDWRLVGAAALNALREPTEAMLDAVEALCLCRAEDGKDIWQAAIDEAAK